MVQSFEDKIPIIGPNSFVHENASIIGDVTLGDHTSVWPSAVLRGDISPIVIGTLSNVQDNVCIHTDADKPCIVGERVTIGHGAILHGCKVGNCALIGMGAIVLDGAVIGEGAVIAAGAVVSPGTQVPAHAMFMGIPARFAREVKAEEAENNVRAPERYWDLARRFMLASTLVQEQTG